MDICLKCNPDYLKPGQLIEINSKGHCVSCGRFIGFTGKGYCKGESNRWDKYFHDICKVISSKSPCLSRKIGAILVRDKSILSTGYNGSPRGVPHCGHSRWLADNVLRGVAGLSKDGLSIDHVDLLEFRDTCPRQVLGYASGTHMELCPAQHAEENAISNAARLGVSVIGSTLYMNSIIPCKNCFGTLINAGIVEIVVEEVKVYDKYTQFLIDNSDIKLRKFEL